MHRSLFKLVLTLSVGLPVVGCSDGVELSGNTEVGHVNQADQCGSTWDLQDVELYDGGDPDFDQAFVAKYEGAFGRKCSGTLIGSDVFLTVEHSSCRLDPGDQVGFGCQLSASNPNPPDPDAAAAANCEWFTVTESWNYPGGEDTSVGRLAGSPGLKYGWVIPARRTPSVGERLALFQHPAADGRRKMIGFGAVTTVVDKDVRYQIDSSGGGSGAGLLDKQGFLVAVNRAHGCTGAGNVGTSMEFIIDQVPEVRQRVAALWMMAL